MKSKDKKKIEYEKENIGKSGISLIVLVITIIVIIIIAGAVILNLTQNNPVNDAKKAKFMSDVDTFKSELSLYVANKQAGTLGSYNGEKLYADKESVTENGKIFNVHQVHHANTCPGLIYVAVVKKSPDRNQPREELTLAHSSGVLQSIVVRASNRQEPEASGHMTSTVKSRC